MGNEVGFPAWPVADRLRFVIDRLGAAGAVQADRTIAAGATDDQLAELEDRLGIALPGDLEAVLRTHAALRASWEVRFDPERPTDCLLGRLDLSLDGVLQAEASRQDWVREVFDDPTDGDHAAWHMCLGLHRVANGDCLGIVRGGEHEGAVLYLSHEVGAGHRALLAPSVRAFVEQWSLLAFVGPEFWELSPFRRPSGALDGHGPAAVALRARLGLEGLAAIG